MPYFPSISLHISQKYVNKVFFGQLYVLLKIYAANCSTPAPGQALLSYSNCLFWCKYWHVYLQVCSLFSPDFSSIHLECCDHLGEVLRHNLGFWQVS